MGSSPWPWPDHNNNQLALLAPTTHSVIKLLVQSTHILTSIFTNNKLLTNPLSMTVSPASTWGTALFTNNKLAWELTPDPPSITPVKLKLSNKKNFLLPTPMDLPKWISRLQIQFEEYQEMYEQCLPNASKSFTIQVIYLSHR